MIQLIIYQKNNNLNLYYQMELKKFKNQVINKLEYHHVKVKLKHNLYKLLHYQIGCNLFLQE
jgi:hypothetical protein